MKKLLVSILAAFMVFAIAGTASADFESADLVMVIYNPADTEIAYDLGSVNFGLENQVLRAADGDILGDFAGTSDLADLNVGIFAFTTGSYLTTFATTEPIHGGDTPIANIVGFEAAAASLYYDYSVGSIDNKYVGSSTNLFHQAMNNGGNSNGSYAGVNASNASEGVGLFENALVDLYLYQYIADGSQSDYTSKVLGWGVNAGQEYVAHIQLSADGQVILNPNAVPVPGALILMASGLLGIVGVRRKK